MPLSSRHLTSKSPFGTYQPPRVPFSIRHSIRPVGSHAIPGIRKSPLTKGFLADGLDIREVSGAGSERAGPSEGQANPAVFRRIAGVRMYGGRTDCIPGRKLGMGRVAGFWTRGGWCGWVGGWHRQWPGVRGVVVVSDPCIDVTGLCPPGSQRGSTKGAFCGHFSGLDSTWQVPGRGDGEEMPSSTGGLECPYSGRKTSTKKLTPPPPPSL